MSLNWPMTTYQELTLTINSRSYKETTPSFKIKNLDESDLFTDKLTNIDLCIEQQLVIKAEDVVSVYFDFDKSGTETNNARQIRFYL